MKYDSRAILRIAGRWKVHHIALWVGYYTFFFLLYTELYASSLDLLIVITLYFVFNATPFYIINYILVPRFLSANRLVGFTLITIILLVACGIGLSFSLHEVFHDVRVFSLFYSFIVGFSSVGFTVGLLSATKVMVDKIRTERRARIIKKEQARTELLYLRAQVNPHFLFNAINSIYVLILKDPEKAAETLIRLSDLLRFQLYDCKDDRIAIESELGYIQNFVALEKLRKGDRVKVSLDLEGDLTAFDIAPFLSVPLMENAFKFVSNYSDRLNEVKISLKRKDARFEAKFFNTREKVEPSAFGGIGLKNVIRRLELIYPGKHELVINEQPDFWESILTLTIASA